jgi:phage terminase small subunit
MRDELTPKQARFLAAYFETGNASAAFREAYGASHMGARYVAKKAGEMLRHPLIAPRVAEARARLGERTVAAAERWGVTAERLIEQYAGIAFYDLGAPETGGKGTAGAKITVTGKLAALDSLARILGLFDKDKPGIGEESPLNLTITIA